ncbi:MAG: hypothetical protein QNJ22_04155 [Desulfosarcinaceae bacterium]|nr:hypothetical protein [Desulfosarcinaceae bacterium]
MSILKRLITLRVRKQRRYKARDGVYVIYDQSMSKNQIDNISMGGLSFYYVDNGIKIDKGSYELSLVNRNRICLGKVPFKTVSDTETGEILFRNKRVKRQSVRFDNLSGPQKTQLKAIIANFTE